MKSHRSRLTILLFLSLLALPAVRTEAQVLPPLNKITSQAELDKAITRSTPSFLTLTTTAIWRSLRAF